MNKAYLFLIVLLVIALYAGLRPADMADPQFGYSFLPDSKVGNYVKMVWTKADSGWDDTCSGCYYKYKECATNTCNGVATSKDSNGCVIYSGSPVTTTVYHDSLGMGCSTTLCCGRDFHTGAYPIGNGRCRWDEIKTVTPTCGGLLKPQPWGCDDSEEDWCFLDQEAQSLRDQGYSGEVNHSADGYSIIFFTQCPSELVKKQDIQSGGRNDGLVSHSYCIKPECNSGATKTISCGDGSKKISSTCVGGVWIDSKEIPQCCSGNEIKKCSDGSMNYMCIDNDWTLVNSCGVSSGIIDFFVNIFNSVINFFKGLFI